MWANQQNRGKGNGNYFSMGVVKSEVA